MKRTFLILFLLSAIFVCTAQTKEQFNNRVGKFILEPVVGIPNAGNFVLWSANYFDSQDNMTVTKNTSAPLQIGGRIEYMITPLIGMSLEANYEKSGYRTETKGLIYDPFSGTYQESVSVRSWTQEKTRFLARCQFHFLRREHVDLYSGFGLGATYLTEDYPGNQIDEYDTPLFPVLILDRATDPLAMRVFIGNRVFFNKNFGMLMEFGIGAGSILNLGATFSF